MSQLRKDPFGPAWVLISPERGLVASDFGSVGGETRTCLLCPGHEAETEPALRTLRAGGDSPGGGHWCARVIPAPHSLLGPKPFHPSGPALFTYATSSGSQELIVEHPDHHARLETMPSEHVSELLKLYRDRLERLAQRAETRHIQLTRNVGRVAGATFEHPHAQLLALPVANRWVEEERQAAQVYHDRHGRSLFMDVLDAELTGRERLVSVNQGFMAVAPFASKTPFETWILPRQQQSSFVSLASNRAPELANLLQSVVRAMNGALDNPPYNMILHTLPHEGDPHYRWHIELLPRLTSQAGFDWSSGLYVNPTPPEDAARFLREALALQGATL